MKIDTPHAVIRVVSGDTFTIRGVIEAASDAAVEVLAGRTEVAFAFAGDAGELVVLAWGSSLTDLIADPRMRVSDAPAKTVA